MNGFWKFYNPVAVQFGTGCIASGCAGIPWERLLLVTTPGMQKRGTADWLEKLCKGKIVAKCCEISPNPEMQVLDALAETHRRGNYDGIIALGGGSALDAGKVLAVLLKSKDHVTLKDHLLEGRSRPDFASLPVVAIPTTSGTGSEVTPFATVWDAKAVKKYSLSHECMFPKLALLDPELTAALPWGVTLSTGLDALCQAFESIWNKNANTITLELAMRAAKGAWEALRQGKALMNSLEARSKIMEASLLAGFAISNTRTALCHSMSYPITARFGVPHGLACGFTMPAVLNFNKEADDGRLASLAAMLGQKTVEELSESLVELFIRLEVYQEILQYVKNPLVIPNYSTEMITKGRSDNNLRDIDSEGIQLLLQTYLQKVFC